MSDELSTTFENRNQMASPLGAGRNVSSIVLLAGSLFLFLGVSVAKSSPATSYEVSIYNSTPLLFWAGTCLSILLGIVALTLATSWIQWAGSLVLTALSVLSVAALPLIRGYFFYGLSDAVRHLGNIRRLVTGDATFFEVLYPAGYSFSGFLTALSGVRLERAMIFTMFFMMAIYVVFIALCVRSLLPRSRAVAIATLSALLFLPLNQISLHPHFHSFSMTTFFSPVVLYVLVKHLTAHRADQTLPGRFSSTDLGFVLTGTAMLFFHPQTTTNVIIILGVVAVTQLVGNRYRSDNVLSRAPPVYGQLLFLVVIFVAWNLQHQAIFSTSSNLLEALNGLVLGTAQGGEIVTQRVDSAESVGLGVVELFVKLFLVPAFYCLVAAGVVVSNLYSDYLADDVRVIVTALTLSGVVLAVYAFAHFVGDVSGYFFRHLGFGMVLVTILGVIGLTQAGDYVDEMRPSLSKSIRVVAVVGLVVAMALSLVVVYPSPYLGQPTEHISEQEYTGHLTALEYRVEGAALSSPRANPRRYATAAGEYLDPRLAWGVPSEALPSDLRRYRGDDYPTQEFYYYIQSELDRERELIAYRGLRFDESDFEGAGNTPGVSHIVSNGELDAYYVEYGDGPVIGTPQERLTPPRRVAHDPAATQRGDVAG